MEGGGMGVRTGRARERCLVFQCWISFTRRLGNFLSSVLATKAKTWTLYHEWYLCLNPYHNHKHSVWNSKFLHNHLHWRLEILKCPENLTYLLWTMGSYMRQIVLLIGYSTSAISVFFFFFVALSWKLLCHVGESLLQHFLSVSIAVNQEPQ